VWTRYSSSLQLLTFATPILYQVLLLVCSRLDNEYPAILWNLLSDWNELPESPHIVLDKPLDDLTLEQVDNILQRWVLKLDVNEFSVPLVSSSGSVAKLLDDNLNSVHELDDIPLLFEVVVHKPSQTLNTVLANTNIRIMGAVENLRILFDKLGDHRRACVSLLKILNEPAVLVEVSCYCCLLDVRHCSHHFDATFLQLRPVLIKNLFCADEMIGLKNLILLQQPDCLFNWISIPSKDALRLYFLYEYKVFNRPVNWATTTVRKESYPNHKGSRVGVLNREDSHGVQLHTLMADLQKWIVHLEAQQVSVLQVSWSHCRGDKDCCEFGLSVLWVFAIHLAWVIVLLRPFF